MRLSPVTLILIALLIVGCAEWPFAQSDTQDDRRAAVPIETLLNLMHPIEPNAMIHEDVTHELTQMLAALIRINGYRCDSIAAARPFLLSAGFHVYCNKLRYRYELADKGGNWIVTVK